MSVCGCLFHSTNQREIQNLLVSSACGPDCSRVAPGVARIGLLVDAVLSVVAGA